MSIFDEKLEFKDLLRSVIINYCSNNLGNWPKHYEMIVHNLYKSGAHPNNLDKYTLSIVYNHRSQKINIYIVNYNNDPYRYRSIYLFSKKTHNKITLQEIIDN